MIPWWSCTCWTIRRTCPFWVDRNPFYGWVPVCAVVPSGTF